MNFGEAIQAMKDGKRVYRKGWESDTWITVNYIANCLPRISFDGHKPWYPSQEDMMSEDWEVKTEPQKANNDMKGLLYLSLLMFFFALENLPKEQDTDCPFNS